MISKMKLNEKGFTLIELMTVITIIGILAAVAIPSFMKIIMNARNSSALQEVENTLTDFKIGLSKGCEVSLIGNAVSYRSCDDPEEDGFQRLVTEIVTIEVEPSIMSSIPTANNPLKINAFHNKGNKTFCLSVEPKDITTYPGLSLMQCP